RTSGPEVPVRVSFLGAPTSTVRTREVESVPSFTTTVTVAVPACFGAAARVRVLVVPDPPRTRLLFGRRAWLEDVADRVSVLGSLSTSSTAKFTVAWAR